GQRRQFIVIDRDGEAAGVGVGAGVGSRASDGTRALIEGGGIGRQATHRRSRTIIAGGRHGVIDDARASAQSCVGGDVAWAGQRRQFIVIDRYGEGAGVGVAAGVGRRASDGGQAFIEGRTIGRQATDRRSRTIIAGGRHGVIHHASASAQSGVGRDRKSVV